MVGDTAKIVPRSHCAAKAAVLYVHRSKRYSTVSYLFYAGHHALTNYRGGGHGGTKCVLLALRKTHWWVGMSTLVVEAKNQCRKCRANQEKQPKTPLRSIYSTGPMHRLVFDFGSFNLKRDRAGNKYFLVAVDHFTKKVWVKNFPDKRNKPVADWLLTTFGHLGVEVFHADNGFRDQVIYLSNLCLSYSDQHFTTSVMSQNIHEVVASLAATIIHGAAYHPQSQGIAEAMVKLIKKRGRSYDIVTWGKTVEEFIEGRNNNELPSLPPGVTPNMLFDAHDWRIAKGIYGSRDLAPDPPHIANMVTKLFLLRCACLSDSDQRNVLHRRRQHSSCSARVLTTRQIMQDSEQPNWI